MLKSSWRYIKNLMLFNNDPALMSDPDSRSHTLLNLQTFLENGFLMTTTTAFLVGFAVSDMVNMNDAMVGVLSQILNICGIFGLMAGFILSRFKTYKPPVILTNALSKVLIATVVVLPLLAPMHLRPWVVLLQMALGAAVYSFFVNSFNGWYVTLVRREIRGRAISVRVRFNMIVAIVLPPLLGIIIDSAPHASKYAATVGVFMFVMLMALLQVPILSRVRDVPIVQPKNAKLKGSLLIPLKDKTYMLFMLRIFLFNLMLFMAAAFNTVYLRKYLGFPYTLFMALTSLLFLMQIPASVMWGRIADRFGSERVMNICTWLFGIEMGIWAVLPPSLLHYLAFIPFFWAGFTNSGYFNMQFTRRYELIDMENRSAYDGIFQLVQGGSVLLASLLGGLLLSIMQRLIPDNSYTPFRLLYVLSSVGVFALIITLTLLKKRKAKAQAANS